MSDITVNNIILCEHVIEGKNNKHTLINTFAGNILVREFPANVMTAFYIELFSKTAVSVPVVIKIILGTKTVVEGGAEVQFKKGEPAILTLPTGLIYVDGPTTLKLKMEVEGMKSKTILNKSISLAVIETTV